MRWIGETLISHNVLTEKKPKFLVWRFLGQHHFASCFSTRLDFARWVVTEKRPGVTEKTTHPLFSTLTDPPLAK